MSALTEFENFRNKLKNVIENRNFDGFIMGLILLNAIVFGLMTSDIMINAYGGILFLIDRLCMAIFLLEITMKIVVYGKGFFKSGWNIFDFSVVAISSLPFVSYFIVLRTFRLFRAFKYMRRFSGLRRMMNTLVSLFPNFLYATLILAVFIYVFSIIAVILFGDVFVEFSSIGNAVTALLQVAMFDSWIVNIVQPVINMFPHSWLFFASFVFFAFMIISAFFVNALTDATFRLNKQQKRTTKRKHFAKK